MFAFLKFWAIVIALWGTMKMIVCRPSTWKKGPNFMVINGEVVQYDPIGAFIGGLIYFLLGMSFVILV